MTQKNFRVRKGLTIAGETSGSSSFNNGDTGVDLSYTLPSAQGASSTVLTNDGTGVLTWALPGGGGSTFGNITVAVVDDNTISTTTGNLVLDSATNLVQVDSDLTITGTSVNLAQTTGFLYSENNDRLNRPYVQSTTGNTSGWRIRAPNATTNAASSLSVANTNDASNNKFLSVQSTGSTTEPFRFVTGEYIAGVLNPSGDSISIRDGTTQYATINPAGPTVGTDLTTKTYVDGAISGIPTYDTNVVSVTGGVELDLREIDAPTITIVGQTQFLGGTNVTVAETSPNIITITSTDTNTTYNIDATSTTGGANLNLNGSDSTTDSVAYKGSGATTVTRTDANTITIASTDTNTTYDFNATSATGGANLNLVGSDSTTDTVKLTNGGHITATYASGTAVTLGSDATDANTAGAIVARDGSGNFSASGATLGAVTVGVDTDQTVSTTSGNLVLQTAAGVNAGTITLAAGANGAITVAPNGTGDAAFTFNDGGNLTNTRNYVLGTIRNSTTDSIGDIWAVNSTGPTAPLRGISLDNSANTAKGPGTVMRSFSGGAATGQRGRLVFEKARGTSASPTANQAGDLLGSVDATGYTSTGWVNDNIAAVVPGSANFNAQENWVSNTNLGTGYSLALAPTATTITSAANLVGVMSLTPQTSAFRADATTFSQGKSGTTTYASLGLTGNTITALNASNVFIRQGTTNTTVPGLILRYQRTDQTGSSDLDGVDFRLSVGGTSTTNNISRIETQYRTSGLHEFGITVSSDNFVADTDTIYFAKADQTKIRTTPAGTTGTVSDTLTLTQLATTLKSDSLVLQNAAGTGLIGNNISYNRVYGQWQWDATVTPAGSNTAYAFPIQGASGTVDFSNIATVGSTSRIIPGAAGMYKLQFSLQVANNDTAAEHIAYIWWRKNGTDVPASMGRIGIGKAKAGLDAQTIAGWDNMISSANTTDYWELMYAVDDNTHVSFPYFGSTAFGPATAAVFITLVPIGA